MPVFDSVEAFANALSENIIKFGYTGVKAVSLQYRDDAFSGGYVPVQDEDLQLSLNDFSNFDIGKMIWQTAYAEKVYEENITGVPEWDTRIWDDFVSDYEKIYAEELEKDII